jgi:hypothetical protein
VIPHGRLQTTLILTITAIVWLFLATDGRYHWDEPGYLHTACYYDIGGILNKDTQPGYAFYSSRILHLIFAHLVFTLVGPGQLGIHVIA